MMPGNVLSSIAVPDVFLTGDDRATAPLIDYEMGGIAIQDTSQGSMYQVWKLYYVNGTEVTIQPDNGQAVVLFTQANIDEMALAFDQNMRPAVAYVANGNMYLRWFDTSVPNFVVTNFGPARNPKLTLDDKRPGQSSNSDVLLVYIRGTGLYYRQQRDRYSIERLLQDGLGAERVLIKIGMNNTLRMQFQIA